MPTNSDALTQHIADGPYTVNNTGLLFDKSGRPIASALMPADVETLFFALNFPARVLEVLREEYQKMEIITNGIASTPIGRQACSIMIDSIIRIAEALGFSREEVTG